MEIQLYNSKLLRDDGAGLVTSSQFFKNGVPDPDGLFSPIIFGETPDDKEKRIARIDLMDEFIHPLIYMRVYQRSFRKIDSLIAGNEKFSVVNGKLVPDPNGQTGMKFFISVMDKLDLFYGKSDNEEMSSIITKELRASMRNLDVHDIVITSCAVTPLAFRDFSTLEQDMSAIDEVNNLYRNLIRLVDYHQTNKDQFLFDVNTSKFKIQMALNTIFEYFEGRTFKKFGAQNMLVLARNIDYSARLVISAAEFNPNNYSKNWVRMDTAGVPLSAVAGTGILYAINGSKRVIEAIYNDRGFEDEEGEQLPLETLLTEYFNNEVISDMIDKYIWSWGERLSHVMVPNKDGTPSSKPVTFTMNGKRKELTLLEFIYMITYQNIEKENICVTVRRYPIQGAFSLISLKTHILTIDDVVPVSFGGIDYTHFPNTAPMEKQLEVTRTKGALNKHKAFVAAKVASLYAETLVMSNLLMKGFNMDRVVPSVS